LIPQILEIKLKIRVVGASIPSLATTPNVIFPSVADLFNSTVPMSVPIVLIVMLVMALAMVMAVVVAVPVSRYILVVVPVMARKLDRLTAGILLRATLAPVFLVARRPQDHDWLQ
jgi:short subunit fatty acids transporter